MASTKFGLREKEPIWIEPLSNGPVTISDNAFIEGENIWKWLINFIDVSPPAT